MSWDFGGGTPPEPSSGSWGDPVPPPAPRQDPVDFHTVVPVGPGSGSGAVSAPSLWLVVGIVVAAGALVLAVVTTGWPLAAVAWALGGPVAIGLLGVFIQVDTGRRADPWYAESGFTPWGRRLLVGLSLLAVAFSAWTIADVAARGGF